MLRIAVLMTCFNRKKKTLACLHSLFSLANEYKKTYEFVVYLTDDGSSDGTADAIRSIYDSSQVYLFIGDGSLYWAGGMRKSWVNACLNSRNIDGYLWLNDDTEVLPEFFKELSASIDLVTHEYGLNGILIGATHDAMRNCTYSGHLITNKFLQSLKMIEPNGKLQLCDLGNGNVSYIPSSVVEKIGILDPFYIHGIADYDYTYRARLNKMPVLVSQSYWGICENDHQEPYFDFSKMNFRARLNALKSPKFFQFNEYLFFQKRFFRYRYPLVLLTGYLKVFFPKLYIQINNLRNKLHR